MNESDSQILKFKNNGSHYEFFEFVMIILDTIFFGDTKQPVLVEPGTSNNYDWDIHNELVEKFNPRTKNIEGITTLNFVQFLTLMSAIDKICKLLLSDEGEILRISVLKRMPDIVEDWDKDFFKSASVIFETFGKMFQGLPEYDELLKMVTGAWQ